MNDQTRFSWKAEWKAAGLDPGPLTPEEVAQVPGLIQANSEFLAKHPPQSVLRTKKRVAIHIWSVPLVAAAAGVLVFLSLPISGFYSGTGSLERIKGNGDPVVVVYRQGPTGAQKLVPRASVRPGDVLQVAYQVSHAQQGALLSLDGEGNVTVHLAKDGWSVALVPGAERPLDFGYELDRAPRYEAFYLFTSDQPFDLEPIRQKLKAAASWDALNPGDFGSAIHFTVLGLTKEIQQ